MTVRVYVYIMGVLVRDAALKGKESAVGQPVIRVYQVLSLTYACTASKPFTAARKGMALSLRDTVVCTHSFIY